MSHVFIIGGTGFIGPYITKAFLEKGFNVIVLVRSPERQKRIPKGVQIIFGDPLKPGIWQDELVKAKIIVNLAGATIFKRWNKKYKQVILKSRVLTTQNIINALQDKGKGRVLLNASAIGYYGSDRGDEELIEDSKAGSDFLAQVCKAWEDAAFTGERYGIRVCSMRLGVVLGKDEGALSKMLPIFKLGLGGPIGSGRQWFSWIHIRDVVQAVLFLAENPKARGSFNFTAPQSVRNKEFSKILGSVLRRPAYIPVPAFFLRLLFGETAQIFTGSVKAFPAKLLNLGYRFLFPELKEALQDLCK